MEAANSFLKILEEPPPRTVFIMTTNNIRLILPTIVSRVRVVTFGGVSDRYLQEKLKQMYPEQDDETIATVSVFSMGKTGKAVQLMESPEVLANYLKIYHGVQNFLQHRNIVDRFSYIEELSLVDGQVEIFLRILTHVLRSKLLEGANGRGKYIKTLSKIDEAGMLLKKNVNAKLVLENLMLEI